MMPPTEPAPSTHSPLRLWLYSLAGLAGFLVVSYVIIVYGLPYVMPFVVALILAQAIEPIVELMTFRGKVPRTLAVAVVLLLFVALISLGITAAMSRLIHEIDSVTDRIPEMVKIGQELVERYSEQFGRFSQSLPASIQEMLNDVLIKAQAAAPAAIERLVGTLTVFTSLPVFLVNFLIALLATFFISRDRRYINEFLMALFPPEWHPQLKQVRDKVWNSSVGFVKGMAILIFMTTIQMIIGLVFIGSNYAVTMGLLVGVADVLPLLGPGAVMLPWAGYHMILGDHVFGIKLLILYAVVVGVRQVLEAKVIGEQMGLHPLATLFSIYMGFTVFGALGLIVGPLLAMLLKALIQSGLLPIFQRQSPIIK